jgi:crossover junction endodeoxyribonuclease RusA
MIYSVHVPGRAYPQGSKRHVGGGRLVEQAGANLKHYRTAVALTAQARHHTPLDGALSISIIYTFQRPKTHHMRNGKLKATAPAYPYPCKRGDIDKLARATCDALTGIWFHDDAQLVELACSVVWGSYDSTGIALAQFKQEPSTR